MIPAWVLLHGWCKLFKMGFHLFGAGQEGLEPPTGRSGRDPHDPGLGTAPPGGRERGDLNPRDPAPNAGTFIRARLRSRW